MRLKSSPAFSIGSGRRLVETIAMDIPGPATYHTDKDFKRAPPRAVFGHSGRDHLNRTIDDPGPGAYDVNSRVLEGPKFSFTKALKDLSRSQTPDPVPGPGAYNVTLKVVHPETAATLTPRRPLLAKGQVGMPGPGTYTPTQRSRSPAYSIGRSMKPDIVARAKTPSPADYRPQPLLKTSPSYGIGGSKRDSPHIRTDSPGPGAYSPKAPEGSPKFSMKLKLPKSALSPQSPGPGHYSPTNTQVLVKGRAAVIGSEPKIAQVKDFQKPPPGTYNISRDLTGPRYSFGRSQRKEVRRDDGPGPGQYVIPSAVANVPSYLLSKSNVS